jgi:hypothetical protein
MTMKSSESRRVDRCPHWQRQSIFEPDNDPLSAADPFRLPVVSATTATTDGILNRLDGSTQVPGTGRFFAGGVDEL